MSGEKYFLEAWLSKGVYKPELIEVAGIPHAHITFIRPFAIPEGQEEAVKEKIVGYCRGKRPVPFVLEGVGSFGNTINYIPVGGQEMQEFDGGIESLLANDVQFAEKLGEEKVLHLTISKAQQGPFPRTELFMLRLTCLLDKKIWFSFDFVTQEVLNREESLDEPRWLNTCRILKNTGSE